MRRPEPVEIVKISAPVVAQAVAVIVAVCMATVIVQLLARAPA